MAKKINRKTHHGFYKIAATTDGKRATTAS
jgi:ribosomal protein L34